MQKFGKESLRKFFLLLLLVNYLAHYCLLHLSPLVHDMIFYDVMMFSYQVELYFIFP